MARGGDGGGVDHVDEHKGQDGLPGPRFNTRQGRVGVVAAWRCWLLAPAFHAPQALAS